MVADFVHRVELDVGFFRTRSIGVRLKAEAPPSNVQRRINPAKTSALFQVCEAHGGALQNEQTEKKEDTR